MENGNRERVKETTTDLIHGHVAETANGHQSEKKWRENPASYY